MILAICTLTIALAITLILAYALRTDNIFDRILAANSIGTKIVIFILAISMLFNDAMFIDVALIYALTNFITTIALLKYFTKKDLGEA